MVRCHFPKKLVQPWLVFPFPSSNDRRRVLVVGGSFSGLAAGRDLHRHFLVTIIDAKAGQKETFQRVVLNDHRCPSMPT